MLVQLDRDCIPSRTFCENQLLYIIGINKRIVKITTLQTHELRQTNYSIMTKEMVLYKQVKSSGYEPEDEPVCLHIFVSYKRMPQLMEDLVLIAYYY